MGGNYADYTCVKLLTNIFIVWGPWGYLWCGLGSIGLLDWLLTGPGYSGKYLDPPPHPSHPPNQFFSNLVTYVLSTMRVLHEKPVISSKAVLMNTLDNVGVTLVTKCSIRQILLLCCINCIVCYIGILTNVSTNSCNG